MERDAYREAGVDIDAAQATKRRIRAAVRSTFGPEVLTDIGSFGGLFKPDFTGMREPVLVSSADGVGTKLKVAVMTGRHDTVGADLVNHCVDDILVMGARPLFFLDYLAYARHDDALVTAVIEGITRACRENGCALIGGEMAELPDLYAAGDYDLAGVIVGVADRAYILDGSRVRDGDVILGLASTGLHTNGFTLARTLIFKKAGLGPHDTVPGTNTTVADALLETHRSYAPALLPMVGDDGLHAMAHITGGGFTGNINRSLPKILDAVIDLDAWTPPPLFRFLAETGGLSDRESYRIFNMGVGMAVMVNAADADRIAAALRDEGETVYRIGAVVPGSSEVRLVRGG